MCLPEFLCPQPALHSGVCAQLRSNPGPGGGLNSHTSHLRLPPLFLHQTRGRQQSKQGLATAVRTLKSLSRLFNSMSRTLAKWERVYCSILIITGIAGGCIATGIAIKNIFNSCMSVPCYIMQSDDNNCTAVAGH